MLTQTVLRTIKENNLLYPNEIAVIAVSGGIDSIALFHILVEIQDELQVQLYVATFDHQLRQNSQQDIDFVTNVCSDLGIPVIKGNADVSAKSKQEKISIETAARESRYQFLSESAHSVNATKVITAHHADDQAETVLMNLTRGTGLRGIGGMKLYTSLPGDPKLLLVRPMLRVKKSDILKYCESHNLQWREDPSNQSLAYFRNRVRHSILPLLEQENLQFVDSVSKLAEIAQQDEAYLEEITKTFTDKHLSNQQKYVDLPIKPFIELHIAIQRRVLRQCLEHVFPTLEAEYHHIDHAIELIRKNAHGRRAEFGQGIVLEIEYDHIYIKPTHVDHVEIDQWLLLEQGTSVSIKTPGMTHLINDHWSLTTTFGETNEEPNARLNIAESNDVFLRTRQPGDKIQLLGLGGRHQKIKDWMINHKVPASLRDRIPLLIVDNTIAAIVLRGNWVISETFSLKNSYQFSLNFFVNCS